MRFKTLTCQLAVCSLLTSSLACDFSSTKTPETGVVLMKLTDAPIDDVESVFVTFSEVAVQRCVDSAEEAEEADKDTPPEDMSDDNEDKEDPASEDESQDLEDGDDAAEETRASRNRKDEDENKDKAKDDNEDKDDDDDEDDDEEAKVAACEHGVWEILELGEQTKFDLLTLQNGKTADLGIATLPTGKYGQIRLKLDDAEIVVKGETVPLKVPSGKQSGIKIVGGFEVVAGEQTELTVDFDAGLSVKYTEGAGWKMKPVIRLLK